MKLVPLENLGTVS